MVWWIAPRIVLAQGSLSWKVSRPVKASDNVRSIPGQFRSLCHSWSVIVGGGRYARCYRLCLRRISMSISTFHKTAGQNSDHRAWTRLPSGRWLDLFDPDPGAWENEDLARRLSRTFRWGGESCWPRPLSVAQHSLLVLQIRRERAVKPLSAANELRELLHDAEEAFLGFDCISPLKAALGEPFEQVEKRLRDAIWTRYSLPQWSDEDYAAHKVADRTAAACEAVKCVGLTLDETREMLNIDADVLNADPLAAQYGEQPWEPWPSDVAALRFYEELLNLTQILESKFEESVQ